MTTLWFLLIFVGLMLVGGVWSIRSQGAPVKVQVLLLVLAVATITAGALNYFG